VVAVELQAVPVDDARLLQGIPEFRPELAARANPQDRIDETFSLMFDLEPEEARGLAGLERVANRLRDDGEDTGYVEHAVHAVCARQGERIGKFRIGRQRSLRGFPRRGGALFPGELPPR